jgi:hypothetical protein
MTDPVSASVEAASRPHVAPSPLLPDDAQERLVAVIRAAFPHRDFPDGPYERTAEHILVTVSGNAFQTAQLGQGLRSLDALRDRPFAALGADEQLAVLQEISATPFFQLVRSTTVTFMYSDREVWQVLGYEGESSDKGGYLHRGFDDLDWLPDPRIEELSA